MAESKFEELKLIDTHTHLDSESYKDILPEVIKRADENGVAGIIAISEDLKSCLRNIGISESYPGIYSAVGIHPHNADSMEKDSVKRIEELLEHPGVVAVGEIGLDFYRNFSTAENQKKVFIELLNLAKEVGIPAVIHMRMAEREIVEILKEVAPQKFVMHCFTGTQNLAREILGMGGFFSFTGVITFNSPGLEALVNFVPLERILLETDSPYMTPVPHRGKLNEPSFVKFIADKISRIKGLKPEEVCAVTTENSLKFFDRMKLDHG
ncbi:MAG: TatD family hydrolase [Fidelibacterota bacterium]